MEDLDTRRTIPGCADAMLRTFESFGLEWDGAIEYQSRRTELYAAALSRLCGQGLTFECSCSRGERAGIEQSGYPGTCRAGPTRTGPTAIRFRVTDEATIEFEDGIQGGCSFALGRLGDFILRRRDAVHAYQLAVVVDDAAQKVTHIVRGADLLPSTAWQIALLRALDLPQPLYAHLPLVVEPDGTKLAKSRRSVPLDPAHARPLLGEALRLLRQSPPPELAGAPACTLLAWAIAHWDRSKMRGLTTVRP